ncbi:MAG: hypothetical protein JNL50_06450 [Phycisphaerae bacterium]|nr:hypothetical protein [Phycisphaerae bacterium]
MMNRIPIEQWHSSVELLALWKGKRIPSFGLALDGYDFRENPAGDRCLLVQRNPSVYGLSAISGSIAMAIGIWLALGGRVSVNDFMIGFLAWSFLTCAFFAWAFVNRHVVFDRIVLSKGEVHSAGRDSQPAHRAIVLRCVLAPGLVAIVLRDGIRDRVLRMYESNRPMASVECEQFLDSIARHAPIHPSIVNLFVSLLWLPYPPTLILTLPRLESADPPDASEARK